MKVMSLNVLCAGRGENHWCRRQPLVRDLIGRYEPDVFGLQEAHYGWMRYISGQFKDTYAYVGVGKDDGGIKGEFSPVFYNKNKFDVVEKGDFWLSETPDMPGLGWDAAENRTCAYAILKDKQTGDEYAVFNTHLDHIGETAIREGAKLIVRMTEKFRDMKTVVTGDFNVTPDSETYKIMLDAGFSDARTVAEAADDINSFHAFGRCSKMIDFVFVNNSVKVREVNTATDRIDGKLPSDHYPVVADIY